MKWSLTNPTREKALRASFQKQGINCDTPGFLDSSAFLKAERANPRILESYAEFIETQSYSEDYLTDASAKIAIAAEAVRAAVEKDGRQGACIDASGMLGRMLDKLGIWNYVAKATLTIDYAAESKLSPAHFWEFDDGEFAAPHAIVVAPPFAAIDVTVRHQGYSNQEERYLPPAILATEFEETDWNAEDLACDALRVQLSARRIQFHDFLAQNRPGTLQVINTLRPRRVVVNGTSLKYVVIAVGGTIEQLEGITGYKPGGRTALQIYQSEVLPKLGVQPAPVPATDTTK